jgi:hypothetical protein
MRRSKKDGRIGTLLFLIPILLVVALVAYALVGTSTFRNGTLTVEAQTSSTYYQSRPLNESVSISGMKGITPFTVSLAQGTYVVTFASASWFSSPPQRVVNVTGGTHSFVVGTYSPIPVHVSVSSNRFNATRIQAMHAVTPVVWENLVNDYTVITSTLTGEVIIPPLQNYTYVFQRTGTFYFSFPSDPTSNIAVEVV